MESADLKIVILSRITFSDEEICGLGVSGHPSASMVIDDIYGPYRRLLTRRQPRMVLIILKLWLPACKQPRRNPSMWVVKNVHVTVRS